LRFLFRPLTAAGSQAGYIVDQALPKRRVSGRMRREHIERRNRGTLTLRAWPLIALRFAGGSRHAGRSAAARHPFFVPRCSRAARAALTAGSDTSSLDGS